MYYILGLFFVFLSSVSQAFESLECQNFKATLPKDFKALTLSVPEDWTKPDEKKISVTAYYRLGSKDSDPVVFFNGGPGFPSWSVFSDQGMLKQIRQRDLNFVVLDQRGNGCSSLYPVPIDHDSLLSLRHYGSRAIVYDSEAIRKHLFPKRSKWKIFGQSYGSFIVHRYVTLFPNSISSAHAHGMALALNPLGDYYYRLLGQKRITAQIFKEHPGVKVILDQIFPHMSSDLCFKKNNFSVCGYGVMDGILVSLVSSYQIWPMVEDILKPIIKNNQIDMVYLKGLVETYIFSLYARGPEASFSTASEAVNPWSVWTGPAFIGVMEAGSDFSDPSDPSNCRRIHMMLEQEGQTPDQWYINECRFLQSAYGAGATSLSTLPSQPIFRDPLPLHDFGWTLSLHKIPFYLYSGDRDTFVPVEIFQDEVNFYGDHITYRKFPNSGHDGYSTENQIWEDISKSNEARVE